jgi:predicted RND superfamily exporter protein
MAKMKKISRFITEHPLFIIISLTAITVFFAISCVRIRTETDIKKLLPENAESVSAYNEIDEQFGGADKMFVLVKTKDVFNASTLSKIQEMTAGISDISGVSKVTSILNLQEIKASPDGIEIQPIVSGAPKDRPALEAFRKKLLADDKYAGVFISKDSTATLILVKLFVEREKDTVTQIEAFCKGFQGPETIYSSGTPSVAEAIQRGLLKDLLKLTPLAFLLVALTLFLSFRTLKGVLLPQVAVAMSTVWSLGLMALTNQPLTVITIAVPTLMASVGSAYGIHVLARYNEERAIGDPKERLRKVINMTGLAILIAATTTIAGFMSNSFADISSIKVFGLITAFGVTSALFISVALIPAIMCFTEKPAKEEKTEVHEEENKFLGNLLDALSGFITKRRGWSLIIAALILALMMIAYPRVIVESDPIRYFNPNSEVVKASALARKDFGGAMTLDILIKGDLNDPAVMNRIGSLEDKISRIPIVSKPYATIVDAIKETNKLMNNNDKRYYRVPDTREGVAQYILLLSLSGSGFLDTMVSSDKTEALISARVATSTSLKLDPMLASVKKAVRESFGDDSQTKVYISGMSAILKDMREMLIMNQVESLLMATVVVFLMVLLAYGSVIGALFCMTPIILTVLFNFGIMGWLNIPIDMATVLVGSIVIGLGIDYSVHFFNRYKEELHNGLDNSAAIRLTMKAVGKPIIYNAVSVAMGFIVLPISEFEILKSFGLLAAFAITFSAIGALVLLPDLLMLKPIKIKFKDQGGNQK